MNLKTGSTDQLGANDQSTRGLGLDGYTYTGKRKEEDR